MLPRFVQIHFLNSYVGTLLNRDDAGFAKRIPFGGETRTRVSSQCLKRHWRTFEGEGALSELGVPGSVRSRFTFERFIVQPLIAEGVPAELARAVTEALMGEVLGKSEKAKKAEEAGEKKGKAKEAKTDEPAPLQTNQVTVLGRPEVEFLLGEARKICAKKPDIKKVAAEVKDHFGKEGKKNLQQLKRAAGLDAALFGRMVTSDILARGDAAVHVAHAFTVHAEHAETDYFAAVDDLLKDEELGSGHINTTELTSGLFYGYVVVDVPLLVSNLEGCRREDWEKADRDLAARVIERLLHLVATVSPGAKLGSTAPYSYAHLVLAEVGRAQPRTFANAFLSAVKEKPDLLANAYQALASHIEELNRTYGRKTKSQLAGLGDLSAVQRAVGAEEKVSLDALGQWVAAQVRGA